MLQILGQLPHDVVFSCSHYFIPAEIKFFKKLENKKEREKGTLMLDCKASNPNNAPAKWFKDGNPITTDDPYV